jgi:hypothetical protein
MCWTCFALWAEFRPHMIPSFVRAQVLPNISLPLEVRIVHVIASAVCSRDCMVIVCLLLSPSLVRASWENL